MRILWLTNITLPVFSEYLGIQKTNIAGWLISSSRALAQSNGVELYIVSLNDLSEIKEVKLEGINYISVPVKNAAECFKKITEGIKPDVIHLHGTEYPYAKIMTEVCPNEKYVVSIQGIIAKCAEHYSAYLDGMTERKKSFRDIVRGGGVIADKAAFAERGKTESALLRSVKNIIGRTAWDKACTYAVNPKARYFKCNETLRKPFYENQWQLDSCERHSIFFSQAIYPLKGLHLMLKAMPDIIKEYPDAHLYVAGNNITKHETLNQKIRLSAYAKYLLKLIEENNLEKNITFTGPLDETEMCRRLTNSHVFVCASSIENSPNSLGEAMLTGVPCVTSCVGGVQDLFDDKKDGFMYPADEYYMISWYVKQIFADDVLARRFSQNARNHALLTHDEEQNRLDLIKIYETITGEDK